MKDSNGKPPAAIKCENCLDTGTVRDGSLVTVCTEIGCTARSAVPMCQCEGYSCSPAKNEGRHCWRSQALIPPGYFGRGRQLARQFGNKRRGPR
jgi:hypothetical protein